MTDKYNLRVLCFRCASELINCGYQLKRTRNKHSDECWKCYRQGKEYRVKK